MNSIKINVFTTLILIFSISLFKLGESYLYLNGNQDKQVRAKRQLSIGIATKLGDWLHNSGVEGQKDSWKKHHNGSLENPWGFGKK
uniref:Uncharacterized protein n=1 Tax=Strongyloides stercoralis TaxID=6248 RepID=A0A0K0EA26_STRER